MPSAKRFYRISEFLFRCEVVDDYGIELAANEVGELWLKSPVVTPGYWRKPEETAKAITDGWFHTRRYGYQR